ncbi:MerR family transcriptional regulator [Litoreibacter roseus]|uniref:HTH merR-type domain-containing protein n=1 Tax=Litoreibacter roseus TaxID=2601869 RepID=A0A6N6JBT2_9RHOB|nr:MerR family transcriptional regulator [Litoreibacter roseus]GFE63616.1 hypothetical protein KIN_06900 [Litoreibacter roseus]
MSKKAREAFRTITEVADWLDVPAHVLRFWESKFSQIKPVKRAGGRRYYRPTDMELIGGIKTLLHDDGLTIRGVQKMLKEEGVKHVAARSPDIETPVDADATLERATRRESRRARSAEIRRETPPLKAEHGLTPVQDDDKGPEEEAVDEAPFIEVAEEAPEKGVGNVVPMKRSKPKIKVVTTDEDVAEVTLDNDTRPDPEFVFDDPEPVVAPIEDAEVLPEPEPEPEPEIVADAPPVKPVPEDPDPAEVKPPEGAEDRAAAIADLRRATAAKGDMEKLRALQARLQTLRDRMAEGLSS